MMLAVLSVDNLVKITCVTGMTSGEMQCVTGLNFLPKLTAAKRAELENFKAAELWPKE